MEKSKTKALCSHRMLDFLCFVLPPRCLSRIKARLARSQTISIHGNKAAVEQQCFSCNNAFLCARPGLDTPGWLAGAHTYSFRIYIYKKPIVAYPSLHSPLSSTLTNPQPSNPTLIFPPQPPIHPSTHPSTLPPTHLTPPPPQKKKRNGLRPLPPPPLSKPLPLQRSTLPALFFAEKAPVRVRVRREDAGGGGAASGAVPGRGGEEKGVSEAVR